MATMDRRQFIAAGMAATGLATAGAAPALPTGAAPPLPGRWSPGELSQAAGDRLRLLAGRRPLFQHLLPPRESYSAYLEWEEADAPGRCRLAAIPEVFDESAEVPDEGLLPLVLDGLLARLLDRMELRGWRYLDDPRHGVRSEVRQPNRPATALLPWSNPASSPLTDLEGLRRFSRTGLADFGAAAAAFLTPDQADRVWAALGGARDLRRNNGRLARRGLPRVVPVSGVVPEGGECRIALRGRFVVAAGGPGPVGAWLLTSNVNNRRSAPGPHARLVREGGRAWLHVGARGGPVLYKPRSVASVDAGPPPGA